MEYRIADLNDLFSLAEMRWDFKTEGKEIDGSINKQEFLRHCVDVLKKGIENDGWAHWIVLDKDNIVSHISINRIQKIPKPNRFTDEYGYVTNVYTKAEYRSKGIGSNLMNHVIKWAKQEDLEILIVWPSEKAIKFYERKGFSSHNDVMELELRASVD